ncbi:hypothetical protein [Flexivirga oryzae]|uniref:Serine aminopeptidase S33 domain-containing protein n=1 Tax=Flexivirga oryzae TaxID=1794944 RepID=A0A839MYA7_9MICO|nr:hypothetical protein [Flexivirga oryzae]MBB2890157.1 hypothetical protein [Flexivirga oryzae]
MIDTPTWFGPAERSLFGWFCTPDSGAASYAVLLCPPIGEEEHNAHETIRRTAWGLAEQGIASLRFDFHGTGDSMGHWSDPGRVPAWLTSVQDAYDALVATGVPTIGGIGMRLGATLLGTAAARGVIDLDMLVLWDPCSGKSMLREGYARRPGTAEYEDGSIETPGYLYGPETVADLQSVDPATIVGNISSRVVLVLARDDRPPARGLKKRLPPADMVEWQTCAGMSDMLDVPMDLNNVPIDAVEQLVKWVAQHEVSSGAVQLDIPHRSLTLRPTRREPIRESTVRLGDQGLFGIVTEPARRTRSAIVTFVNVANDRQTGPGRHWVDMARDLASEGFRCVRLSQSGTGDSPTLPGQTFGELYCTQWLTDLPNALSDSTFDDGDIALVSLCSGAYSSLEAAMRVRVAAVYPINVILTIRDTSRGQRLHSTDRRVARPANPAFLPRSPASAQRRYVAWRVYRQLAVWHAPLSAVHALVRRGTAVVLVMSPDDGRHFWESAFWSGLFSWRWRRAGAFRLHIDERIDHPLMTQDGQQAAINLIHRDLVDRFPSG